MKSVLILLSTYNGEKYLKEQLDSIYCQKEVDVHLLVRDDCSNDRTIQILQDYKNTHGKMHLYQGENVGAAHSFFNLLQLATEFNETFDYYCYSDQDDVWFDDKLVNAISLLEKSDNKYKLAFSDLLTTDEKLNPFKNKSGRYIDSIYANIVSHHMAGCCQVFNRDLLLKLNYINNPSVSIQLPAPTFMHDTWTALVTYSLNGDVIHDDNYRMYYRQHGNNVIGNNTGGLFSLYKKRIKRYSGHSVHAKSLKCKYVLYLYKNEVNDKYLSFIDLCANYRSSLLKKLKLLFSRHLYNYSIGENVGAFLLVLFNKF